MIYNVNDVQSQYDYIVRSWSVSNLLVMKFQRMCILYANNLARKSICKKMNKIQSAIHF